MDIVAGCIGVKVPHHVDPALRSLRAKTGDVEKLTAVVWYHPLSVYCRHGPANHVFFHGRNTTLTVC
jgi:hypothetical protein